MIKNDNEIRFVPFLFFREEKFEIGRKARSWLRVSSQEDLIARKGRGGGRARHRYAEYPGHRKESETSINSDFGRTLDPVSCLTPSLGGGLERFGKSLEFYFQKNPPPMVLMRFLFSHILLPAFLRVFRTSRTFTLRLTEKYVATRDYSVDQLLTFIS